MHQRERASEAHERAVQEIARGFEQPVEGKRKEMIPLMRRALDERGQAATINSTVKEAVADGVAGEWVIAPNADAASRVLYIHGGGYVMGSPMSHRRITSRLSEMSGAVVLAIDYRLMPENSRQDGIEDCRTAYDWILANGPNGASEAESLIVAGDSSGGNLALATVAWARDTQRPVADAVVVLGPQTDVTLTSPSLVSNSDSDVMQGKSFGPIVRAPRLVSRWLMFMMHRANPSDPVISPLLGDLAALPPTLLQVSESEMFLDDSIRYGNKSNAQGTTAVVQTWPNLMHVWHNFDVPEADEAFEQIGAFLQTHVPRTAAIAK